MAQVGDLYIGGKERNPLSDIEFLSGVGFTLHSRSHIDYIIDFEAGLWEVELHKEQYYIVARCKNSFDYETILTTGFDMCQKALDLISTCGKGELFIETPGIEHIVLFLENDKYVLRQVSNTNMKFTQEIKIEMRDISGNLISEPPKSPPKWNPAFRYYRLSQTSSDLFEAYRNLYLAFESLLHEICPKASREREEVWFKRALSEIGTNIDLKQFVPMGTTNPVAFLFNTQYTNIRCKLFHSKEKTTIPHEKPNPVFVAEAYERLIRLWLEMAVQYANVDRWGGAFTHAGFKLLMDNGIEPGFSICLTGDPTPSKKDQTLISPGNFPVFFYPECDYDNQSTPGVVKLIGRMHFPNNHPIDVIHRTCVVISDDTLFLIAYNPDGIYPTGVDVLETNQTIRLINYPPKTIF